MGNLDFSANADQLKELAAYMASQINVPTIGIGGGYAPIGTIIPLMGTTAPQDYLACDGTVYNIADYPQLADYFESQFGESNHFGGDGTTTFAVPDLRGEFLRGTGTNSHTNQGSGANVGVHQDGTKIPLSSANNSTFSLNVAEYCLENADFYSGYVLNRGNINKQSQDAYGSYYTSRPTNTSVLYCIKAVVAGEVYSTDERVVGTWIDGRPLYQITFSYTFNKIGSDVAYNTGITNMKEVIAIEACAKPSDSNTYNPVPTFATDSGTSYIKCAAFMSGTTLQFNGYHNRSDVLSYAGYATIKYTKTTD